MDSKTLSLGLTMAGSVSAGAYTAGVVDYLLDTLKRWQSLRSRPDVPDYKIVIEVLSGASGGGMTAGVAAAMLQKRFDKITQSDEGNFDKQKENLLYNSWVNLNQPDGTSDYVMMHKMLDVRDILGNKHKEVVSLLNSSFIADVAAQLQHVENQQIEYDFLSKDLDVIFTLTNLRGIPYSINFNSDDGQTGYRMSMHADFAHFKVDGTKYYTQDGRIPLSFDGRDGKNKDPFISSMIATGAFPIGLSPQVLKRSHEYIEDNILLNKLKQQEFIWDEDTNEPVRKIEWMGDGFTSLFVDGGVINNEPFDVTKKIMIRKLIYKDLQMSIDALAALRNQLREIKQDMKTTDDKQLYNQLLNTRNELEDKIQSLKTELNDAAKVLKKKHESTDKDDFTNTILMVDPFPNYDESNKENYLAYPGLRTVLGELVKTMRNQLMFKEEDLTAAMNNFNFSRFMIAPHRTVDGVAQPYPIACGSLDGFGGFFSRKFRAHDYYLGRRNCQMFLRNFFVVPADTVNPIFKPVFDMLQKTMQAADFERLYVVDKNVKDRHYRIIPDLLVDAEGKLQMPAEEPEPKYPNDFPLKELEKLELALQKRFWTIVRKINNTSKPKTDEDDETDIIEEKRTPTRLIGVKRKMVQMISKFFVGFGLLLSRQTVARGIVNFIIRDFEKRGLMKKD